MALYLGSTKVTPILLKEIGSGTISNYSTGTITSDDNGIITFPELDFTPKMIAVWNVKEIDLKQEAEDNGEEWDDEYAQYSYTGIMLFAIYQDGVWFSQALINNSGETAISNASVDSGSCITINENVYSYKLIRSINDTSSDYEGGVYDITNTTFNYVISG